MIKAQEITFVASSQNKVLSKPESVQIFKAPGSISKQNSIGFQSFTG